jgi:hypothetical protein
MLVIPFLLYDVLFFVFLLSAIGPSCASPNAFNSQPKDVEDRVDLGGPEDEKKLKRVIIQCARKVDKGGKASASCAGVSPNSTFVPLSHLPLRPLESVVIKHPTHQFFMRKIRITEQYHNKRMYVYVDGHFSSSEKGG